MDFTTLFLIHSVKLYSLLSSHGASGLLIVMCLVAEIYCHFTLVPEFWDLSNIANKTEENITFDIIKHGCIMVGWETK